MRNNDKNIFSIDDEKKLEKFMEDKREKSKRGRRDITKKYRDCSGNCKTSNTKKRWKPTPSLFLFNYRGNLCEFN